MLLLSKGVSVIENFHTHRKNCTEVEKFSFIIMCGEVVSSFVSNVLLNEPLIFKLLSSHLTVKLKF